VWKKSLFADLNDEQLKTLSQRKTVRRIAKNGFAFRQGEAANSIFCVAEGTFKVVQKEFGQAEKVVRLVAPGGPVGHRSLFTAETYRGSCAAKEKAVVCHIPKDLILELLDSNTEFSKNLITRISADLIAAENELYAGLSVARRLAALLMRLQDQFGDSGAEECRLLIQLTKVEIASMLTTTEETIVRTFNKFKSSGWVRFEGKKIVLLSPSNLRKLAESRA
jgi:CRP/FNR family transcriptional regulator, polysaccharide utilization system transcription regulator